jgi:hypothetical protein
LLSGVIIGSPILPSGWKVINSYICGPTANLTKAVFTNMNLGNIDISGANLTEVVSGNTTGTPILPSQWILQGGYIIGPTANLTNAILTAFNLDNINIDNHNFYITNLNYTISAQIEYEAPNYARNYYYIHEMTLTNSSQMIYLYLLNESKSTLTELEVKWDEPGHPTVLYDYSLEDIDIVPGDTGE